MALVVASIGLPLTVIGASYLCWYKTDQQTFWSWTCDRARVDRPEVEFEMVCGEVVSRWRPEWVYICVYLIHDFLPQKFAFTMGWVVAAAESLMFINVLVGCIMVRRKV